MFLSLYFQHTSNRDDNSKNWVITTRFPSPPEGAIPDDDDTSNYYSRATPTFTYTYDSTVIFVFCKY